MTGCHPSIYRPKRKFALLDVIVRNTLVTGHWRCEISGHYCVRGNGDWCGGSFRYAGGFSVTIQRFSVGY
jgi:hypothetical protein